MNYPYEWHPRVVSTQLALVGNIVLAAVPGEFTTMSGRRLKGIVRDAIVENGGPQDVTVIIAGLSNHYTDYVATFEEYQVFICTQMSSCVSNQHHFLLLI